MSQMRSIVIWGDEEISRSGRISPTDRCQVNERLQAGQRQANVAWLGTLVNNGILDITAISSIMFLW